MAKKVSLQEQDLKQERSTGDQIKRYKERNLSKTYLFKVATWTFGPPKSRRRIIIAPPMEKQDSKPVSTLDAARQPRKEVVSGTRALPQQESDQARVTEEEELLSWISERRIFRAQLDNMVNLRNWLQKKSVLTELEAMVLKRLEKLYIESLPSTVRLPQASVPVMDMQLDDLATFLSSSELDILSYKDLVVDHKMWKLETRETQKEHKLLKTEEDSLLVMDVQAKTPDDPAGPLTLERQSSGSSLSVSSFLDVPPVSLDKSRLLTYEDMEAFGNTYRERRRKAKSTAPLLESLEKCQMMQTGIAAIDKNCMPSTLGGDTREAVNNFRKKCFLDYLNVLHLCQQYDVSLSEELLQKALLFPGDNLLYDPKRLRKTKRARGPFSASGKFTSARLPPSSTYKQLLKSRQPGALSAPFSKTAAAGLHLLGDTEWQRSRETGTPSLSGRMTATGLRGLRERSLKLRQPGSPFLPSEFLKSGQAGVTLPSGQFTVEGRSFLTYKKSGGTSKKKSSLPYPSREYVNCVKEKLRGEPQRKHQALDSWITFEDYEQMLKNLRSRYAHLFFSPSSNAFWPGSMLDKLRLYLPNEKLRPEECLFSYVEPKSFL
ncbi:EF-hand calcium-binding domain-containing protein 12-like isoform X2 [Rhinatrema bivittatum]|uniref:EF-hand calcium-binding domain-containing protein 12-like isoform X2 n=1 Tax=Rhinatrema bivittatum TaxID=194408 RepID=UPI00112AC4A9|nr:EF-hand calcium-binding domain-containing protein 12-like isoform X2 [Rhinatrema bivittatum]